MDPHGKFLPPQTEDDFMKRAKDITPTAATAILSTLEARREVLVKDVNAEIDFYKKVLKYQKEGKL